MIRLAEALYAIAITVWVGGLLAIGYVATPVLFSQLSDHTLAGNLAGGMFSVGGWISLACAVYLLLFLAFRQGRQALRNVPFWLIAVMLVLALIGQFVIQPIIVDIKTAALPLAIAESPLHAQFARWHGISSVVYLVQSALGIALIVLQRRGLYKGNAS